MSPKKPEKKPRRDAWGRPLPAEPETTGSDGDDWGDSDDSDDEPEPTPDLTPEAE